MFAPTTYEEQWNIQRKDFKNHKEETVFDYRGYTCKIARYRGHWCGYVYLNSIEIDDNDYNRFRIYDIHCGITYIELKDNKMVIGFDCAHFGDFSETSRLYQKYYYGEIFRTFNYVESQIKKLVDLIITENIYKP